MDRYIRDEREFSRELMKRATEEHVVKGKERRRRSKAARSRSSCSIFRNTIRWRPRLARRLRDPKLVELLAASRTR